VRTSAPAIALTAALLVSLAGCSTVASEACTSIVPAGAQAGFVDATGAVLTAPDVTFPTPLTSAGPQRAVLVAGEGPIATAGRIVDFEASLFDGETGNLITASAYDPEGAPLRRTAGSGLDLLADLVQCTRPGSRLAATATIAEVFGAGQLDPALGLGDDDPVVLVIDIESTHLAQASGAPQLGASGVPAVVTTPQGQPGITIPDQAPSDELISHVLVRGDGATIAEGDRAVLHYTGVVWETGAVFDSSWDRGSAVTFTIASFLTDPSGVVPGLAEALIGTTVGSRVVVVIPPALGYPEGQSPATIPPGSTMVFVIDLLGIEK
jgi:hypothetical protein